MLQQREVTGFPNLARKRTVVKGVGFPYPCSAVSTPIEQFDYHLPERLIAQASAEPRDHSRLLVLDRGLQTVTHRSFFEIGAYLKPGDVLVFNDTKVFKARLRGRRFDKEFEVFLLRPMEDALPGSSVWHALVRPGKKLHEGNVIEIDDVSPTVVEKREDGSVLLSFPIAIEEVFALADAVGEIPVPPYVEKAPKSFADYQTVYARNQGAVAAPTAGFHFTERLLNELRQKGIQTEFVTLHVGLGTFRPVKTATLEEHEMHAEFVDIDAETSERVLLAKKEGRRVIAVGTTVVRALEATGAKPHAGDVNIFITPGYVFKIVDGLVTNFHLPKTTLLALVCAFAGREFVLKAYEEAIKKDYRFYSFGDAMLIL